MVARFVHLSSGPYGVGDRPPEVTRSVRGISSRLSRRNALARTTRPGGSVGHARGDGRPAPPLLVRWGTLNDRVRVGRV